MNSSTKSPPSEGNKKGDAPTAAQVQEAINTMHWLVDEGDVDEGYRAAVTVLERALGVKPNGYLPRLIRPQPRKATGDNDIGHITMALSLFASAIKSGEDWTPTCETALRAAFDAVGRLSVSPAAAQGWQMVEVPKIALDWLFGRGPDHEGHWFGDAVIDRPNGNFWWRTRFDQIVAAAPPSPAAPEQEK